MSLIEDERGNKLLYVKLHVGPIRNAKHSSYVMSGGAADELILLHIMKEIFYIQI